MTNGLKKTLDERQKELSRIDNKPKPYLKSMITYTAWFVFVSLLFFLISIYFINYAKTNAGSGIAWFASFVSFLFLAGSSISLIEILLELRKRK